MAADEQYPSFQSLWDTANDRSAVDFMVRMILSGTATAKLVKVMAVDAGGGALAEAGTVDVQPMVHMIDAGGVGHPHGIIHGLPYSRMQGGVTAIILDPVVGDIGFAVFMDRDISSVKANKAPALPGSRRQFDLSDGIYLGGILNAVPTRYVRFSDDGTEVVDPAAITLKAPNITLDGDVHVTGDVMGDGDADFDGSVTGNGIVLDTHHHTGVTTGGGNTGGPA